MSSTADRRPASGLAGARAETVASHLHGAPVRPRVEYQGLVTRGIAFTIDAAIINVVAVVVAAAASLILSALSLPDSLGAPLVAGGAWLFLLWSAGYFVTFWSSTGQTPGNRVMQIRVVRADDGAVLRPWRSVLRLIGLMLAALPLFLGFLPILLNERRRGLQDVLGGTVVVDAPAAADTPVSPRRLGSRSSPAQSAHDEDLARSSGTQSSCASSDSGDARGTARL